MLSPYRPKFVLTQLIWKKLCHLEMCFFANEYYPQQLLNFTISKAVFLKNLLESTQNSQLLVLLYHQICQTTAANVSECSNIKAYQKVSEFIAITYKNRQYCFLPLRASLCQVCGHNSLHCSSKDVY